MIKKIIIINLALVFCCTQSEAASIHIDDINIKIEGGMSASGLYFENPGFLKRHDSYIINDALIEFRPEVINSDELNVYGGIGVIQKQTIDRIFAPLPPVDVDLQYGWINIPTYGGRYIEVGQLITKLGYESSISYKNKHSLLGAVWSKQPNFYPGVRFNGPILSYQYYIEVTNDSTIGDASAGFGFYKNTASYNFSFNYYDAIDGRNMIDVVYSNKTHDMTYGINVDYQIQDDPAPDQDKNGFGMALYFNYSNDKLQWPVRVEFIDDGNSGIYGYHRGYTLTFSPTYSLKKNQFIRAELLAAHSDGQPFRNSDGGFEGNQFIASLQAGITF